jgi:hypothetical protein
LPQPKCWVFVFTAKSGIIGVRLQPWFRCELFTLPSLGWVFLFWGKVERRPREIRVEYFSPAVHPPELD